MRIAGAFLIAACGSAPHPLGSADVPEAATTAPATAMLASSDDNHVTLVEVADRVIPRGTFDLAERVLTVRWLDRDRLVALGESGQLYLVTMVGDATQPRVAPIAMPAAQAWALPIPDGAEREPFPSRAVLAGTGSVSLVSCIGVVMGDTNPCVAWAGADVTSDGTLDAVTALGGDPPDATPPSEVLAPALGIVVHATFAGPTASVECTARGAHKLRELPMGDPACGANRAEIAWVATEPPLIGLVLHHACGVPEGLGLDVPEVVDTRVLAACELTEFEGARDPIVWRGGWAHFVSNEVGWHVHAGVQLVGTIVSDEAPQLRPR